MCDRLLRKGFIRRHRARADRRAVQTSITEAGRQVADQATARRRVLIGDILSRLSAQRQPAAASALRGFAVAAGDIPDSEWPAGTDPAVRENAAVHEDAGDAGDAGDHRADFTIADDSPAAGQKLGEAAGLGAGLGPGGPQAARPRARHHPERRRPVSLLAPAPELIAQP
jgi:hypothetical protein